MEPNSAKENAPKMERIAPTIHAAKTTETLRPSRAISAGLRKIPVPIIVPRRLRRKPTRPARAPSPNAFRSIYPRLDDQRARCIVPLRLRDSTYYRAENKSDNRANHEVPRIRHARKLEYA